MILLNAVISFGSMVDQIYITFITRSVEQIEEYYKVDFRFIKTDSHFYIP